MKITSINNNIVYRRNNAKNSNITRPSVSYNNFDKLDIKKADKLSFKGREETLLKLEAKKLLFEAKRIFSELKDLRDNSYVVLANSVDIKKFADEVLEKSPSILDDARKKYNHGKLRKFKPIMDDKDRVARDYLQLGDKFVIEDYKDYRLEEKVIYDENSISMFKRNPQTGKFDMWVFDIEDGSLVQFGRDVIINEVKNSYSAKEQLIFEDNKLYTCDLDYIYIDGQDEYSTQQYEFSNNNLSSYFLGKKVDYNNASVKASEYYVFDGPVLLNAYKKYSSFDDGSMQFGETYGYDENGEGTSCLVGLKRQADGASTTKKAFYFNENGLNNVRVNITAKENLDGKISTFSARMYTFDDVEPIECFIGASQATDTDVRCERAVKLK